MTHEKRADRRQQLDYPCWIAAERVDPPGLSARIFDISKAGARLVAKSPDSVPDEFILHLTEDGQVKRKCWITWRKGEEIGIVFFQKRAPVEAPVKPVKQHGPKRITPARPPR